LIFVFAGAVSSVAWAEEDVEGSKDHPMISRYEGSVIKGYEHVDYDRIEFPSGVEDDELQTTTVEGEVTKKSFMRRLKDFRSCKYKEIT